MEETNRESLGVEDWNASDSNLPENEDFKVSVKNIDVFDPAEWGQSPNPFEGEGDNEPWRVSGNDKTLLKTLTQGDVKSEILQEVNRKWPDDPEATLQNTTQGIIDNLDSLDCVDNTFEYKKESTIDDWNRNSTREHQNQEDYETLDNYFFGFGDSLNAGQQTDVWEGEESPTTVKVNTGWTPFKQGFSHAENARRAIDDHNESLNNSLISADSFDSVKRINKEDDKDELNQISEKLMKKIQAMKASKLESEGKKSQFAMNTLDFSTPEPPRQNSPMHNYVDLPTVNEEDEINLRKQMKHKRAHSSSSNNPAKQESIKQAVQSELKKENEKELEMLRIFKVTLNC